MSMCKDLKNIIDRYDPVNVECRNLLIDPKETSTRTYEIFKKLMDSYDPVDVEYRKMFYE